MTIQNMSVQFVRCSVIIASFLWISSIFANRITGPTSAGARCPETLGGQACQDERTYALNSGCITKEEHDSLVTYNAYPICDRKNVLRAWCSCGCFEEGTKIYGVENELNGLGYVNISKIILDSKKYKVVSLSDDAKLSDIKTQALKILNTTSGPETAPLVVFRTANDQRLAVTQKHAILLADGRMVEAKNVKKTDFLVQADGKAVAIKNIESENVSGNVLNILTSGKGNLEHTLFAEGLIVGDLAWQNNLKNMLNAIAIRE